MPRHIQPAAGTATFKIEVGDTGGATLAADEAIFSDPDLLGALDEPLQGGMLSA